MFDVAPWQSWVWRTCRTSTLRPRRHRQSLQGLSPIVWPKKVSSSCRWCWQKQRKFAHSISGPFMAVDNALIHVPGGAWFLPGFPLHINVRLVSTRTSVEVCDTYEQMISYLESTAKAQENSLHISLRSSSPIIRAFTMPPLPALILNPVNCSMISWLLPHLIGLVFWISVRATGPKSAKKIICTKIGVSADSMIPERTPRSAQKRTFCAVRWVTTGTSCWVATKRCFGVETFRVFWDFKRGLLRSFRDF